MSWWTPMRRSIAIGVALTAAATGAHTWLTHEKDLDKYPVAHGWAALERCLIGEPLAEGENVEQRLRMITLGSERDWPKRCTPYARALEDELPPGAFDDEVSALRRALEQDKVYYEHERFRVRTLFQLASWRVEGAAGDVSAVPVPARAKPVTGLAPLGEQLVGSQIDARADSLVVLFDRESHACRLAAEARGEIGARCLYFPDDMPRGRSFPRLVPGEGPDVVMQVPGEATTAAYSLASARVLLEAPTSWYEPSGYHAGKGVALVGPKDGKKMTLFRAGQEPVDLDDVAFKARIIGDDIVWREERGTETILFARHVPPSGAPEERVEIGSVGNGASKECRTPAATFVWITVVEAGEAQKSHLAVRTKSGWKLHDGSALAGNMFCQGSRASFVAVRPSSRDAKTTSVSHASCGEDGCRRSETALPFPHDDDVVIAPVGDRLLVARLSFGVRVRVAPLKDLPTASEQMVFDSDGVHGGSLVHDVRAYPIGEGAVLLLHTGDGTFAIGAKPDATFYPVRIAAGS